MINKVAISKLEATVRAMRIRPNLSPRDADFHLVKQALQAYIEDDTTPLDILNGPVRQLQHELTALHRRAQGLAPASPPPPQTAQMRPEELPQPPATPAKKGPPPLPTTVMSAAEIAARFAALPRPDIRPLSPEKLSGVVATAAAMPSATPSVEEAAANSLVVAIIHATRQLSVQLEIAQPDRTVQVMVDAASRSREEATARRDQAYLLEQLQAVQKRMATIIPPQVGRIAELQQALRAKGRPFPPQPAMPTFLGEPSRGPAPGIGKTAAITVEEMRTMETEMSNAYLMAHAVMLDDRLTGVAARNRSYITTLEGILNS